MWKAMASALLLLLLLTEISPQGLTLARQAVYQLSHSPGPFCFSYFWSRVSLSCLDCDLSIYASHIAETIGIATTASFLMVSGTILLRLALNYNSPNICL
jgi:hypothetical protein